MTTSTTSPATIHPIHLPLPTSSTHLFISHASVKRTRLLNIIVTCSRCRASNPSFLLSRRQRPRSFHRNFTMALHPVFPTTSSKRICQLLLHLRQPTQTFSRPSHLYLPAPWVLVSAFPSILVTKPPVLPRPPLNPRAHSVDRRLAIRSDPQLYLCRHPRQTQRHHLEKVSMVAAFVSSRRWSSRRAQTHPEAQHPGAQHLGAQHPRARRLFGHPSRLQIGRYAIMIRPAVRSLSAWSRLSRERWPTSALSSKHRRRESGASVAKPRKLNDSLGLRIMLFDSCIWLVGGFSVGAGFGVPRAHFLLFKIIYISLALYCLVCLRFFFWYRVSLPLRW